MTEPWPSVDEVAKRLGVAQDSDYRWIEGRGLPAHEIGRLWKFKLSEVVRVRARDSEGREKAAAKSRASKSKRGRS